jgi:hypothetical protein
MSYLMDSICATSAQLHGGIILDDHFAAPKTADAYRTITTALHGAPRFLLDDAAIETAVELTLGRPKVLLEALHHVRLPYPRLWVEWSETGREELRRKLGTRSAPLTSIPTRLGFLIESDPETGRSGRITWAWLHAGQPVPNIAAVVAEFDLDQKFPQPARRRDGLMRGEMAQMWDDNPEQLRSLLAIWETALHKVSDWGAEQIGVVRHMFGSADHTEDRYFSDVYGEYIVIWAIVLLLTASRPIIDYQPVSLTKLNKIRRKKNQTPLLDHTRVIMHLNGRSASSRQPQPLSYQRKSPRVHMVASYLARRGEKHWIVQAYMRGSGETVSRHVRVVTHPTRPFNFNQKEPTP